MTEIIECAIVAVIEKRKKELVEELRALEKKEFKDKTKRDWDRQHKVVAILSEIRNWISPGIWRATRREK